MFHNLNQPDHRFRTMRDLDAAQAIYRFEGAHRFLSNYAKSEVTAYGVAFPTVEHAFAGIKNNPIDSRSTQAEQMAIIRKIASAPTPGAAKKFGRSVMLRENWDNDKYSMVFELLKRKFSIPEFRDMLISTGDRPLVEFNTWNDRVWGMTESNGNLHGNNALGRLLELLRSQIRLQEISN